MYFTGRIPQTRLGPLRYFLRFQLREVRQDPEKNVRDEFVVRVQVRLGVDLKADAERVELLQVKDGLSDALATEAVERPEHHQVEAARGGVLEEAGKGRALLDLAACVRPCEPGLSSC